MDWYGIQKEIIYHWKAKHTLLLNNKASQHLIQQEEPSLDMLHHILQNMLCHFFKFLPETYFHMCHFYGIWEYISAVVYVVAKNYFCFCYSEIL